MKKSINFLNLAMSAFFLFAICICNIVNAQANNGGDSLHLKSRIYKASVVKEYTTNYGYLANLSDSGLQLSSSPIYFSTNNKKNFSSAYNYNQLKKVIIQRKGSAGRGALIGALSGLGAGVITGLAGTTNGNGEIVPRAVPIFFFGIIGTAGGALIGAIIGGVGHQEFIIDGNKNKYDSMRESIFNKLFRHHSSPNNYSNQYVVPQL